MNRNNKIAELFSQDFICKDFFQRGKADAFHCPLQNECKVNQIEEPIWSPSLGDEGTEIMIVAEAPSGTGGLGPYIAGLTKDWKGEKIVDALFNFVKKHFSTVPYFTDLMKCGLAKQTKEAKKIFKNRISNCISHYLIKEIEIIKPRIILCLGSESYSALQKAKSNNIINKNIEIIKLIHYGRQANLPLTIEDKENLIWPFQVNKISKESMVELDYFNRRKE